MKTLKHAVAFCLLSLVVITSCGKNDYSVNSFLISTDSIKIPERIVANTPFDILMFGTVGTNGCNKFSHFEVAKNSKEIKVEIWGEFKSYSGICPEMMVYLGGEKLNLRLDESGTYVLKIKQMNGTFLEKHIIVE